MNPKFDREFKERVDNEIEIIEKIAFTTEELIMKTPITEEEEVKRTIHK